MLAKMLKMAPPKLARLCQISELTVLIASFGDGYYVQNVCINQEYENHTTLKTFAGT